mmetsp:Transcript_20375/g.51299  ORF Transcript_20375/g.51299 Transcript_20375/m.51299 type:complete len:260 (-) Transcript_20375:175-954(-)
MSTRSEEQQSPMAILTCSCAQDSPSCWGPAPTCPRSAATSFAPSGAPGFACRGCSSYATASTTPWKERTSGASSPGCDGSSRSRTRSPPLAALSRLPTNPAPAFCQLAREASSSRSSAAPNRSFQPPHGAAAPTDSPTASSDAISSTSAAPSPSPSWPPAPGSASPPPAARSASHCPGRSPALAQHAPSPSTIACPLGSGACGSSSAPPGGAPGTASWQRIAPGGMAQRSAESACGWSSNGSRAPRRTAPPASRTRNIS